MNTAAVIVTRFVPTVCLLTLPLTGRPAAADPRLDLMPLPARVTPREGSLAVDAGFRIALNGYREPRLERAANRLFSSLARITGVPFEPRVGFNYRGATLTIRCAGPCKTHRAYGEDESYRLDVTPAGASLDAANPLGVLRGLATFVQLVRTAPDGFVLPALRIDDRPRFPWRGLLIDVCRHWQPPTVIKRTLTGMSAVKLNVLHLRLSDDQAFRVQCNRFRRLHTRGSSGHYFTQRQVRDIVDYARDLGIRVLPEFDTPAHTTAWLAAYRDLAAVPTRYEPETTWGVFTACFDPTRENLYTFLDGFFAEMSPLFPDPFFHTGGDDVTGVPWNANPDIRSFMQRRGMNDPRDLHTYFSARVGALLAGHRKTMIVWDDVLQPPQNPRAAIGGTGHRRRSDDPAANARSGERADSQLPGNTIVQCRRDAASLAPIARAGFRVILSAGYQLDGMQSAADVYRVDPQGGVGGLTAEQRARILGGEACLWTEFVTPETFDSRAWPRLAAVAERLWSPPRASDLDDMYRRLDGISRHLNRLGLRHRADYVPMLERLAGRHPIDALRTLCDVVEPVAALARSDADSCTTTTPLNRLVDAARPESQTARRFRILLDRALAGPADRTDDRALLRQWLRHWRDNHVALAIVIRDSFLLREIEPLSRDLSALAGAGLEALDFLDAGRSPPAAWTRRQSDLLERAAHPRADLTLAVLPALRTLITAPP